MASDRDLTYGRQGDKHDKLLEQVRALLPEWLTDDMTPMGIVAKVIWLDQQVGKDRPDNVIWMSVGYGLALAVVELVDPELKRLMESEDPADADKLDGITTFKVKFTYPGDDKNFPYPSWMSGQERTFQFYGPERADEDLPAVFTVTPDGKRICLH